VKIIFGLGNPGKQYKNTRHNIGKMVVEELSQTKKLKFKRSITLRAFLAKGIIDKEEVIFVKPQNFMNNSGRCVVSFLKRYRITEQNVLIVHDDIDLLFGQIRFRRSGSSAGHKGMDSIIAEIGNTQISRLKLGVGRPDKGEISDYVLSDFKAREQNTLDKVIKQACLACKDWVFFGSDFVVKSYNRRGGLE